MASSSLCPYSISEAIQFFHLDALSSMVGLILADVIQEEFGVYYHPGHVRKLLHRLGCSVQRPTTRLVQADPRKQDRWIRYTYANLKKTPKPNRP